MQGRKKQDYWDEEAEEAGEPAEGAVYNGVGKSGEAVEVVGAGSLAGLFTFF